ncbi:MAG: hypothetical protein Q8M94_17750 [Ignavibacteria bacterium]|nr:hypothetical protein [Ignavibacteria bacterium]
MLKKNEITIKYIKSASTKKSCSNSPGFVMAKKGWDKPTPKKDRVEYMKIGEDSLLVMTKSRKEKNA